MTDIVCGERAPETSGEDMPGKNESVLMDFADVGAGLNPEYFVKNGKESPVSITLGGGDMGDVRFSVVKRSNEIGDAFFLDVSHKGRKAAIPLSPQDVGVFEAFHAKMKEKSTDYMLEFGAMASLIRAKVPPESDAFNMMKDILTAPQTQNIGNKKRRMTR